MFKCTTYWYIGYQVFVTVQLCHGRVSMRVSISPVYTAVSTFSGTAVLAFFRVRPCHGFFMHVPWHVRVTFFPYVRVTGVYTHIAVQFL